MQGLPTSSQAPSVRPPGSVLVEPSAGWPWKWPLSWSWQPKGLRVRMTLLYMALMAVLLGLLYFSTVFLMQRNLLVGLERDLAETNKQFAEVSSTLGLKDPYTEQERDERGELPRVRSLFADSLIQVDDLGVYYPQVMQPQLKSAPDVLLKSVRNAIKDRRYRVSGVQKEHPLALNDQELMRLIAAPSGKVTIDREIPDLNGKAQRYRVLVTLGEIHLDRPLDRNMPAPSSYGITYVGRSMMPILETMTSLHSTFLSLMAIGLLITAIGSYLLAGRILRPLQEVRQAAESIGSRNLTQRVPEPPTNDEVQALARSVNAMLTRLESSFEAQRRFTSDASHELRTPVTAISGHASYLLRRTKQGPQEQESLRIIVSESERLTSLISTLLQLARSDSGALNLNRSPLFSGLFLQEVAKELAPVAASQGSQIRVSGDEVTFEADAARLKQVLINLISNSLKAGAKNVVLHSAVQPVDHAVLFTVQDDGPGIPPEHLNRLFDRFYRIEDSRSRHQGGAGLGLSIAKGIVDSHQGQIWLESEVGRGTRAYVQIPIGNVPVLDEDDIP